MDLGYKDKAVIVTGGGSNIGRAISLTFAGEGANVVIAEIDTSQGEKVAKEADALKAGGKTIVAQCDVTDLDSVSAMIQKTIDEFGRVSALVNNVGWDQLMLFTETTPDFWDKIISINYKGALNCTKAILTHYIDNNGGSIVSMSSDASRMGEFREAVYGGCKAAINSFMKTIARENGKFGVRCNAVCPGVTIPGSSEDVGAQSMWADRQIGFDDDQLEKIKRAYPLRKIGKPQDVANTVVFLSSELVAGHITGQVVSVSGGYSMVG